MVAGVWSREWKQELKSKQKTIVFSLKHRDNNNYEDNWVVSLKNFWVGYLKPIVLEENE